MADQKITQLTALSGTDVTNSDVVPVVDVAPTATTKKMTRTEFFKNVPDMEITDKIIHSGDTNTAIRFPAVDTFTVETAGSERVRIDSSGNVGIGTNSPATTLDVDGQISGKFTDVGTNTAAQALEDNHVSQVTIDADTTLTTTVPPAGSTATVIIVTSGAVSRTVTFGTGFASTGTLSTGATASRRFVVAFVSDGTRLLEVSRTTAITV